MRSLTTDPTVMGTVRSTGRHRVKAWRPSAEVVCVSRDDQMIATAIGNFEALRGSVHAREIHSVPGGGVQVGERRLGISRSLAFEDQRIPAWRSTE